MSEKTAVEKLRGRAKTMREQGNDGLADLFEANAAKGEEHAAQYLEMMSMVGKAARRIREREGW